MWHAIENFLPALRAADWMPITAVRVLIGVFFCISGAAKLFVPAKIQHDGADLGSVAHPISACECDLRLGS